MFARTYAKFYNVLNKNKDYKKEIKFVYKWADKPKSVFDIGAGNGDYWKYYPPKTIVIGVEKSKAMAGVNPNIVCLDVMNYKCGNAIQFDCATALFDVINYIPEHTWWKNIPLKKGGYFIFDIFDKNKVEKDGFKETSRTVDGTHRKITPQKYNGKMVDLKIEVWNDLESFVENHRMYIYSIKDIATFCGKQFDIVGAKQTETWRQWFKLVRK